MESADIAVSAEPSDFRQKIDWDRPWMRSLRELGAPLCAPGVDWRAAVNAIARDSGLATEGGRSIQFVAQSELPAQVSYESFIYATGKVPTRANLHDFFNGLIWSNYPRIKARLNALQAADIAAAQSSSSASTLSAPAHRSRLRDALTLFDENAVLVVAIDPSIFSLLRERAWTTLFVHRRAELTTCFDAFPFGHALIEKLVSPYKAITAHAWPVLVEPLFFTKSVIDQKMYLDISIAQQIDCMVQPAAFLPLPVLGVPGWWQRQDEAFYADHHVFRPLR